METCSRITSVGLEVTTAAKLLHKSKASGCFQLSEPILLPKLRIHFADFPYLLSPIGQSF
jgi:hypothetical protein